MARTRLETADRFGVFSSPEHLAYAKWLVGGHEAAFVSPLRPKRETGVLLFYPTRERSSGRDASALEPVMGFGIVLPASKGAERIAFSV